MKLGERFWCGWKSCYVYYYCSRVGSDGSVVHVFEDIYGKVTELSANELVALIKK